MPFLVTCITACLALFSGPVLSSPSHHHTHDELLVPTSSGPILGFFNDTAHRVRGFLGIPYAQPPIGKNRFRAPVHLNNYDSDEILVVDHYSPICPGQYNNLTSLYTILPYHGVTPQDEDCLTVNIWAPSYRRKNTTGSATVMVFIFGGGFFQGGSSDPFIDGATIVSEQDDIIFVNFNYRLSILGFSASSYLDPKEWNVGLLDQRMAIEWLYNNIANFGGDPNKIMLMGQSAGSYSVDLYLDAWAADPIIYAASMLSGANLGDGTVFGVPPAPGVSFSEVAVTQQCTNASTTPEQEFECMQNVDVFEMLSQVTTNGSYGFGPLVDNVTCFQNASERIVQDLTADIPLLMGSVADEGFAFIPFSPSGENATLDAFWNQKLKCAVAEEANLRASRHNRTVFRYYYTGVYHNNLSPYPWLGTYHSSDYPMILGTVQPVLGNVTEAQKAQLQYMQGAWVAFARDPYLGLINYGWSAYGGASGGSTIANLAPNNGTGPGFVQFIEPGAIDALCT